MECAYGSVPWRSSRPNVANGFAITEAKLHTAIAAYWEEMDAHPLPLGQTLLARDASGKLIGSGVLKRLDNNLVELKRLCARPSARGTGSGRRPLETRIATARCMRVCKLTVDTLSQSEEMQVLFNTLNSSEIAPNISSTTAKKDAATVGHTLFCEYDLEAA